MSIVLQEQEANELGSETIGVTDESGLARSER